MAEAKWLTTGAIADYCGVNFRTVIRWIKKGNLKAQQLPGRGDNRVAVADFINFLKKYNLQIPEDFNHTAQRIVLIVDDDESMANSIQRLLRKYGMETVVALDGFKAGALMGTLKPDFMTLDIQMPGISGLDVVQYVRSNQELNSTKILVISGVGEALLKEAVKQGANDYLVKPFKNEDLIAKVEALLKIELRRPELKQKVAM